MTDTPRTDAAWNSPVSSITRYTISQQLERELAAMTKERDLAVGASISQTEKAGELQAENERLRDLLREAMDWWELPDSMADDSTVWDRISAALEGK